MAGKSTELLTGIVHGLAQGRRYGTVGPVAGDRLLDFEQYAWEAPPGIAPMEDDEVRYQPDDRGRKALRVVFVRRAPLPEVDQTDRGSPPVPVRPYRYDDREGAFLNPYNFVRALAKPSPVPRSNPAVTLLGRCPPVPLDRYVGLTGQIRCTLTTGGPVFVADSHQADEEAGHRRVRFYRTTSGGQEHPAIPASSLRGAVRSVFEAVTNSCFEHVHNARLGRRFTASEAKHLVPAQLRFRGGKPQVVLLKGEHAHLFPNGPSITDAQYAAWVPRIANKPYGRPAAIIAPDVRHGSLCYARVEGELRTKPGRCTYRSVIELGPKNKIRAALQEGEEILVGYYCANGVPTIPTKHDERFFHRVGPPDVVHVDAKAVGVYRELLESYRDLHARREKNAVPGPPPSRFVRKAVPDTDEECDGHLVYAWVEGSGTGRTVRALAPVMVPRLLYNDRLRERLPRLKATTPCSVLNAARAGEPPYLCPACRTFGWVMASEGSSSTARRPAGTERREADRGAYRSRVRFGDAVFRDADLNGNPRTLPILAAPKPSAVRFYLAPATRRLRERVREEKDIDYDTPGMELRGRKFYRGRGAPAMDAAPSSHNRTILDHLEPGKTASFTVSFQNLARVELGALLWALELDGTGWQHRLGMGKPLGMGAATIRVNDVEVMMRPDRYGAEPEDPALAKRLSACLPVADLKDEFRAALALRFGSTRDFSELENVRDLAALLSADPEPRLPVQYPWFQIVPETDEGGHVWFGINRRAKKYTDAQGEHRGEAHWLDLADGDGGLPNDPTFAPPPA